MKLLLSVNHVRLYKLWYYFNSLLCIWMCNKAFEQSHVSFIFVFNLFRSIMFSKFPNLKYALKQHAYRILNWRLLKIKILTQLSMFLHLICECITWLLFRDSLNVSIISNIQARSAETGKQKLKAGLLCVYINFTLREKNTQLKKKQFSRFFSSSN